MSRLALYLLGPPRVERDGVALKFRYRKHLALLAYLALAGPSPGGESHTRESLITLLWPELEPSRARAILRRDLSLLRKALGGEWLVADRETVSLDPDTAPWVDVDQFRQRLAACKTHAHPPTEACRECIPLLEEAAALYRDHFLAGFTLRDSAAFDEFQFFQTEGLKDQLAGALVRLATYHTSQGDFESAISHARRWLALDPLHEPAHQHLMRLYAQASRRAAALRQYRECVRILADELDLPPADETTALYERIRAEQARTAEAKPAPARLAPSPASLPAFLSEGDPLVAVERPVFVAREHELARLDRYLGAALAGKGQVAFVIGGPGRGKTALLHEFARRAMTTQPDLLVAGGNCSAHSGLGDPYLPFREAMGMLTGDVEARWAAGTVSRDHARRLWAQLPTTCQALVNHGPFLIDALVPGPALLSRSAALAPSDAAWLAELRALSTRVRAGYSGLGQSAIFVQVTNVLRAVAARSPLLLTLDDLQWADSGSISLLFHLGRRLEGARVLIIGAYRPEEVAVGRGDERHPLEEVLGEFRRSYGGVWVDLRQADEAGGKGFVDAFLDTEPNRLGRDFRGKLFQHTGGHPLFTVELLRAMQDRADVVQGEGGAWVEGSALDWKTLPARVEAVVDARLSRLGHEARDILTVASVEGEWFTAQVVAQVQGVTEREVLRALSQELQVHHRLVREEEEVEVDHRFLSRYRFAHALFQQYLYDGLSAGERRLLHGEVGAALETLYGAQSDGIVAQLAHQYAEAGDRRKAIEYSLRAGDQALRAYANEEAVAHFDRALTLLDGLSLTESRQDWRLAALKGLGQTYFEAGELEGAEENLRATIALGREMGLAPRELVRIHFYLAETLWWQGRFEEQIRIGEEGLALLGDDTESLEAALMNDVIGMAHWFVGKANGGNEIVRRNAQLVGRLPYSPELRAVYCHIIGLFYGNGRDVKKAMRWLQVLKENATAHQDLTALGSVHCYTGRILRLMGNLREGISRTHQALALFAQIGDVKHECQSLPDIAYGCLSLGDLQNAEEYADGGLETNQAIGHEFGVANCYCIIGVIAFCQGDWGKAVDAFERGWNEALTQNLLGQAYLAQGGRDEALRRFQEALALAGTERWREYARLRYHVHAPNPLITSALSGLEAAYDDPDAFRAFCRRFQEDHPAAGDSPFVQWFLEPVGAVRPVPRPCRTGQGLVAPGPLVQGQRVQDQCEPPLHESPLRHDDFTGPISADWAWVDPFGDCSFAVGDGLEIKVVNERDIWHINLSAPRLLRPASGNWAVQTACAPASEEKPAIGGLLVWKDSENYIALQRGSRGERYVVFYGCRGNQDLVFGHGHLPLSASRRVFLRLERIGERVSAFCSPDGKTWFGVGHVSFPAEDPLQVGLNAVGAINRTIYHGAYPDGTAIRFESFQMWDLSLAGSAATGAFSD